MYSYDFGQRLKQLRKNIPLNQGQLALRVGVSPSLISAYETGNRFPSCEVLLRLSRIFHVSVDYLLGQEKYISILVNDLDETQILLISQMVEKMREQTK